MELTKKPEHLEISDQENIVMNGIVDSLGLIKIINFLEERFSLKIQDEDIIPEHFENIESISNLLERMLISHEERR